MRRLSLLLVLLVFAAFWPALDAGFVDWDDDENFLINRAWRGLTADNLRWMAATFHMGHWHPLTWLTLGADYEAWGLDPRAMHRTSVGLHAAAAVAFFFAARRLLARAAPKAEGHAIVTAALLGAGLFAVHPLRVESVAWLTERRDVLSGLFFFLSLDAWLRYVDADRPPARRRGYVLALAFFTCGLLSKASLMVLPALLLILDVWPLRRGGGRPPIVEKLPFAALSAAAAAWAWQGQAAAQTFVPWSELGLVPRLVIAGYAAGFYVAKTLFPATLLPLYVLPPVETLLTARYVVPALGAAAAAVALLLLRRRAPAVPAAGVAYIVLLAPTLGLTQAGPQIAADRYTYLAAVPLSLLAAGALFLWPALRLSRAARLGIAGAVVAVLSVLTFRQSRVWQDPASLWGHMQAHGPESHHTLGHLAGVRERAALAARNPQERSALLEEAVRLYERADVLSPHAVHQIGLANAQRHLAELDPERSDARVRQALRHADAALARGQATGRVRPGWRRLRGSLLLDLGRFDDAAAELAAVVAERPDDVAALGDLGTALLFGGRPREAVARLDQATRLDPQDTGLWGTLAMAHEKAEDPAAARAAWTRVWALCGGTSDGPPACPLAADALSGRTR